MYTFVVAVWLGNFRSEGDLAAYMERDERFSFPEPSLFTRDIGLKEVVDDLVEFVFNETKDWQAMIQNLSYSGFFSEELMANLLAQPGKFGGSNAILVAFGQKSSFGKENEVLFEMEQPELPDTPLIPAGKYYFNA
jgi:hypothetical protein